MTPLHWACFSGLSDEAVKLIENGAAVNAVDEVGIEWRWLVGWWIYLKDIDIDIEEYLWVDV